MKKSLCALTLLAVSMTPALANNGNLKVKTVKNMYNAAIKSSISEQDLDTLSTLFKYSDKTLQNAIALSRVSRMSDDGIDFSECHSAYETLIINPSNGFAIEEAQSINYKVLNNGRVRASVKYTSEYNGLKDFSLTCSGNSCKVTDVFDADGSSGKRSAERLCR